jgi:anti-anti-sigma regulatory factor
MRAASHRLGRAAADRRSAPVADLPPWGGPRADGSLDALRVEVCRRPAGTVVTVHGELDAAGEPLLTAVIEYVSRTEGGRVAVDLTGVPYADTHGLLAVLRRGVVVVAASRRVDRLLSMLGAPDGGTPTGPRQRSPGWDHPSPSTR